MKKNSMTSFEMKIHRGIFKSLDEPVDIVAAMRNSRSPLLSALCCAAHVLCAFFSEDRPHHHDGPLPSREASTIATDRQVEDAS